MVNQVLYHLGSRGIEVDLLPWQEEHQMPIMAYSPLAQGGSLRKELVQHETVIKVAEKHGISPYQLLLAWTLRSGNVLSLPKSSSEKHVKENAFVYEVMLSAEDLKQLDEAFPAPMNKVPLDIV